MRKVFWVQVQATDGEPRRALATWRGRLIVATTEDEVLQGPSREVADLEEVTVADWMRELGA